MPALRARLDDLPLLVRDFIAHNIAEGRGHVQLSPRALAALGAVPLAGQRARAREPHRTSLDRLQRPHRRHRRSAGEIPARRLDARESRRPSRWEIVDFDTTQADARACSTATTLPHGAKLLPTTMAPSKPTRMKIARRRSRRCRHDRSAVLPEDGLDLRAHLLDIERKLVTQALDARDGVVAHAARLLNLRRTTLVEKLRKLGSRLSGELATED